MRNAFIAPLIAMATLASARPAMSADPSVVEESGTFEVGQLLPELTCTTDTGRLWRSADYVRCKLLVIYFSTGDFSDGSIEQAKGFREGLKRLEELNVDVLGVSGDTVGINALFKKSHGLKYTLLADPEGNVAEKLGVPVKRSALPTKVRARDLDCKPIMDDHDKSIIVKRNVTHSHWTFIVDLDGKIISKRCDVNPASDADDVRKVIERLSSSVAP